MTLPPSPETPAADLEPCLGAARTRTGHLHLMARGQDNQLHYKRSDGEAWSSTARWTDLGGQCLGAPALASCGKDLFVFILSPSQEVLYKQRSRGRWGGKWQSLGGASGCAPVAVGGEVQIDLFITDVDGEVQRKTLKGERWTRDWDRLGGAQGWREAP